MRTFCIPIKVTNEEDLYDKFYPSSLSFSREVVAYLGDYLAERRPGEDIRIELQALHTPDMERFRTTYKMYVEKLIRRNRREIRRSDLRALVALLFSVVLISLGYTIGGRADAITVEIISSVGSFSLWTAIALYLETLPTLRYKDKILKKFARAEICCRETGKP